ncbi:MAG: hypothetical protein ACFFAN_17810 [Promethearchaeota archaeon]
MSAKEELKIKRILIGLIGGFLVGIFQILPFFLFEEKMRIIYQEEYLYITFWIIDGFLIAISKSKIPLNRKSLTPNSDTSLERTLPLGLKTKPILKGLLITLLLYLLYFFFIARAIILSLYLDIGYVIIFGCLLSYIINKFEIIIIRFKEKREKILIGLIGGFLVGIFQILPFFLFEEEMRIICQEEYLYITFWIIDGFLIAISKSKIPLNGKSLIPNSDTSADHMFPLGLKIKPILKGLLITLLLYLLYFFIIARAVILSLYLDIGYVIIFGCLLGYIINKLEIKNIRLKEKKKKIFVGLLGGFLVGIVQILPFFIFEEKMRIICQEEYLYISFWIVNGFVLAISELKKPLKGKLLTHNSDMSIEPALPLGLKINLILNGLIITLFLYFIYFFFIARAVILSLYLDIGYVIIFGCFLSYIINKFKI